jgi:hypothetical protein
MKAVWPEKTFWNSFVSHTRKLSHAETFSVLQSGEPIPSANTFNERVKRLSRDAHERKMRGLYVDFMDGIVRVPEEVTEHEAIRMIDCAQQLLERAKATWVERVRQAKWWSEQPWIGRFVWLVFLNWAIENHYDRVLTWLREISPRGEHESGLIELLREFEQEAESAGGWWPYLERLEDSLQKNKSLRVSAAQSLALVPIAGQ